MRVNAPPTEALATEIAALANQSEPRALLTGLQERKAGQARPGASARIRRWAVPAPPGFV
jgi:hypothetical protein